MENDLSEYWIWSFVVNIVVEERIQSTKPSLWNVNTDVQYIIKFLRTEYLVHIYIFF